MHQLLWIELLLKLAGGLVLIIVPGTSIRALGLPGPIHPFWPRLLGAVLVGLGLASGIEGAFAGSRGLGLAGSLVINLMGAAMICALLVLGQGPATKRGRAVLWLLTLVLVILSMLEIAHV